MMVRGWRTLSGSVDPYLFDLDGGRLCLDFANTLSQRTGEHLAAYADFLAFARQAGLLSAVEADRLRGQADRRAHEARAVLRQAHTLRSALYGIFSAVAAGREPLEADLEVLNACLAATLRHARVAAAEDSFVWDWAG